MASSRSIGSIYAELSLKDKMSGGLKKAQSALGKFAATSAKWAGAGLAAGVSASSAALLVGSKRTLAMTDELVDMSSQTGIAIADMMKLQQAYKMGGREASNVGKDVSKMQRALVAANAGGNDPFAALGLSAAELIRLNPADQFQQIGAAIMQIQNPAERTAKAMEIFGKGGMGLTTVFDGMEDAERALGRMPELAQRFGAAMGEANDLIGNLPLKSDQFFMGFTAGIVGQILPGLRMVDDYDFTNLGQNLASSLMEATNVWAAGMNAVFDGIMSQWGDGFDLAASFQKYLDAGSLSIQEREDAAAAITPTGAITGSSANLIGSPAATTRIGAAAAPVYDRGVNDYQRRGLSLDGGNQAAAKTTETNSILREMQATIKRMEAQAMTAAF